MLATTSENRNVDTRREYQRTYHGNGGGGGSSGVVGDIGTPTARMMSSKNDDGDDYNDDGIGREKDIIGSTISSKSLKVKVCCKTWK